MKMVKIKKGILLYFECLECGEINAIKDDVLTGDKVICEYCYTEFQIKQGMKSEQ